VILSKTTKEGARQTARRGTDQEGNEIGPSTKITISTKEKNINSEKGKENQGVTEPCIRAIQIRKRSIT